MTWRNAFTQLAAVSVTGVSNSYDLSDLPSVLPAADLPALVPLFDDSESLFAGGELGFSTLTFDGAIWQSSLQIDHVLYVTPAWSEAGISGVLPELITLVDNYLTAFSTVGTLNDALDRELAITRVQPGVMEYAGVRFYGVRFRHRWVRTVTQGGG